jgi:hypothetical protein
MYEARHQVPLSRRAFRTRLAAHVLAVLALLAASLALGIAGFMAFAKLAFVDALLNASMLLSGMGPVSDFGGAAGKVFASFYALYSGLVFIVTAAMLFTPLMHRLLHKFHWSEKV